MCAYLFKIVLCLRCYVKMFFHHGIFQIIWVSEDIFHLSYSAVTWVAAEGKAQLRPVWVSEGGVGRGSHSCPKNHIHSPKVQVIQGASPLYFPLFF